MRCAMTLGISFLLCSASLADTATVTLEDGTVIQIDGVPKNAKLRVKTLSKPEAAKLDFDAKAVAKQYIEENTNDPKKLEIIAITPPVDLSRVSTLREGMTADDRGSPPAWQAVERPGVAVGVRFRAANVIGAVVRQDALVLIGSDGKVFAFVDGKDAKVHASAAARRAYLQQSDPAVEGLDSVIRDLR